jgi:hypothetical protein
MFSKKVCINFVAESKEQLNLLSKPYPSIQNPPEWYTNTERYIHGIKNIDEFNDPNSTIKKCMPVVDMLGAGYHIPLHSDVWMENNGEEHLVFRWAWEEIQVVSLQKPEQHSSYPVPPGYYKSVFKWINPWIVQTPPGWSCLFVHPQHHEELPFKCLPALVDTDKHPTPVNIPFFVKKGFDGLIPINTPFVQIIPFKRAEFTSSFSYDKDGKFKALWNKAHTVFFERYQRFFWTPKKYEQGKEKSNKCPFGFGG